MRFLVDNALSPVLATLLTQAGHDALHVRTIELHRADDVVILERAAADDRIVRLCRHRLRRVARHTHSEEALSDSVSRSWKSQARGAGAHYLVESCTVDRRAGKRQHRHIRTVARTSAGAADWQRIDRQLTDSRSDTTRDDSSPLELRPQIRHRL